MRELRAALGGQIQFGLWLSLVERLVRKKFTTRRSILLRYVSAGIYARSNTLQIQN
jgi:hypothetical protein